MYTPENEKPKTRKKGEEGRHGSSLIFGQVYIGRYP